MISGMTRRVVSTENPKERKKVLCQEKNRLLEGKRGKKTL